MSKLQLTEVGMKIFEEAIKEAYREIEKDKFFKSDGKPELVFGVNKIVKKISAIYCEPIKVD